MLGAVNSYNIKEFMNGFPFDSYSPLMYSTRARRISGYKVMKEGVYGCCASIGSAGLGLVPMTSVTDKDGTICFNMYIPGNAVVNEMNFDIDTDYPKCGNVKITVNSDKNAKIILRVPQYSKQTSVKVNGIEIDVKCGYNEIEREWHKGDVIEFELDVRIRTFRVKEAGENGEDYVCLKDKFECDCQLWNFKKLVHNRYQVISRKYNCILHVIRGNEDKKYKIYPLYENSDKNISPAKDWEDFKPTNDCIFTLEY